MNEPLPIDADAPRYAPFLPLPGHRYLPGINARPEKESFRLAGGVVPEDRLHETELFRFGVDLFNRSFFWEAHEAWETLWQDCPEGPYRQALQGLIQLAAALLKEHLQVPQGALRLARTACERLDRARENGARVGIDLGALTQRARAHFFGGELGGPPPGIRMTALGAEQGEPT
jgi:uncharacterized protein